MNLSPVTPTTFNSLVFHRNTELSSVDAQIQDLFRSLKVNKDSREVTIHKLPPFLPLDVFKNIISKIPQNLKSLRIISSHLNDLHLELLAKENWIRKLTHLDLSDNLITFEGIYRLQDELPEIHHLSLKRNFLIKKDLDEERILKIFPHLQIFNMNYSKFDSGYDASSDTDSD